jgi:tetratricopeptide (TPR) repeat protein
MAADFLLQQPGGLDLLHASNAAGLRSLVAHLGRAGRPEVAITWAKSALDAWPDEAVLHELYAVALEQDGRPRSEVEASHSRALELDPEHARSQRAIARLAADAGDLATALEAYERALSSVARGSLEEAEFGVEAATLLLSSGRDAQAMQLLEDLLWRHPYDSQVVALLAERLRAESPTSDRALELTRRATRFRSWPEPPPDAAGG